MEYIAVKAMDVNTGYISRKLEAIDVVARRSKGKMTP
jgi:hypothetical protein